MCVFFVCFVVVVLGGLYIFLKFSCDLHVQKVTLFTCHIILCLDSLLLCPVCSVWVK